VTACATRLNLPASTILLRNVNYLIVVFTFLKKVTHLGIRDEICCGKSESDDDSSNEENKVMELNPVNTPTLSSDTNRTHLGLRGSSKCIVKVPRMGLYFDGNPFSNRKSKNAKPNPWQYH